MGYVDQSSWLGGGGKGDGGGRGVGKPEEIRWGGSENGI